MDPLLIERARLVVDPWGFRLRDPATGTYVGRAGVVVSRMVWAPRGHERRRYVPAKSPAESVLFGMSFEYLVPRGVALVAGSVAAWTNTPGDVQLTADLVLGAVSIKGRLVYAQVTGGIEGTDYQLRWSVTDTANNVFNRMGLILCTWP